MTHYPNKEGKTPGLNLLTSQIKSDKDMDNFKKAVINYNAYCKSENKEKTYIKHFSTFCSKGQWRDWIDYEGKRKLKF